jgi:hypothetical protein
MYSDRISALHSESKQAYYYVGFATVTMTARDKFNNTLTDQFVQNLTGEGYSFYTYMNYSSYGYNPEREWDVNTTIYDYDAWYIDEYYTIHGELSSYRRTGGADLTANLSMYSIDIRPIQRGYYDVYTLVCEKDGVPCINHSWNESEFVQTQQSPQ